MNEIINATTTAIMESIFAIFGYAAALLVILYKEWSLKRMRKNLNTATELIEKYSSTLAETEAQNAKISSQRRKEITELKNERKRSNDIIQRMESLRNKVHA